MSRFDESIDYTMPDRGPRGSKIHGKRSGISKNPPIEHSFGNYDSVLDMTSIGKPMVVLDI